MSKKNHKSWKPSYVSWDVRAVTKIGEIELAVQVDGFSEAGLAATDAAVAAHRLADALNAADQVKDLGDTPEPDEATPAASGGKRARADA